MPTNQVFKEQGKRGETVVRYMQKTDLSAAKQIVFSSFIYDRFHSDPAIPDQIANQLHSNWIEDSFKKNPNDYVSIILVFLINLD